MYRVRIIAEARSNSQSCTPLRPNAETLLTIRGLQPELTARRSDRLPPGQNGYRQPNSLRYSQNPSASGGCHRSEYSPEDEFDEEAIHDGSRLRKPFRRRE